MINTKAGEKIALVGTIDPQTVTNTELFTDVVDLGKFHQALGIALLGNMCVEVIDFAAYTCLANGAGAVSLKSITQLASSATANDASQAAISVRAEELITSGNQYVKFGLKTGGTVGGPAAVVALGVDPRVAAVSSDDLASVVEIKL